MSSDRIEFPSFRIAPPGRAGRVRLAPLPGPGWKNPRGRFLKVDALRRVMQAPQLRADLAAGARAAGARLPDWPQAVARFDDALRSVPPDASADLAS